MRGAPTGCGGAAAGGGGAGAGGAGATTGGGICPGSSSVYPTATTWPGGWEGAQGFQTPLACQSSYVPSQSQSWPTELRLWETMRSPFGVSFDQVPLSVEVPPEGSAPGIGRAPGVAAPRAQKRSLWPSHSGLVRRIMKGLYVRLSVKERPATCKMRA